MNWLQKPRRSITNCFRRTRSHALLSAKLDAATKQQKQIETLLEAGKVRPVDATLARTAVLAARQEILVAEEQALLAEKELHELTGLSDAVKIQTVEPKIESPIFELAGRSPFPAGARKLSGNIDRLRRMSGQRSSTSKRKEEGYLPQMEIVGQYALFSRTNNYEDYFRQFVRNNFLLGLSVQVPIFNGTTGARVARSRQEASEARYKLESLKSELKLDIQRGLGALRIARGAVDLGAATSRPLAKW